MSTQPNDYCDFRCILERRKTAIVGSWLGTLDGGLKVLQAFNADGTFTGSVQTEASTSNPLGSHTLQHGVWQHLGGWRFRVTFMDIFYDINTGQLKAFGKVLVLLTLAGDGDEMSGLGKAQVLDPDGNLLAAFNGNVSY